MCACIQNSIYKPVGSVIVKCAQTGKHLTVKPGDLSPDSDEPLSRRHFSPGFGLMLEEGGKPYPVQFVCFAGMCTLVLEKSM